MQLRHSLATLAATTLILSAVTSPSSAVAPRPHFPGMWQATYPTSVSDDNVTDGTGSVCVLCHAWDPNGPVEHHHEHSFNAYGWQIREFVQEGVTLEEAMRLVENLDADQDPAGRSNLEEILIGTQPGWTPGRNNTVHHTDGTIQYDRRPARDILGELDAVEPGEPYCFGDRCPCGLDEDAGCANSRGFGASLFCAGSPSVGVDDLELIGTQLPAGELALFLAARSRTRIPFGAGLRCVAGPGLMRLGAPHSTGPEGIVRTGPGIATAMEAAGSMGADLIGAAWHFQVWYRDSESSCEGGFNLTNGYTVTFKP